MLYFLDSIFFLFYFKIIGQIATKKLKCAILSNGILLEEKFPSNSPYQYKFLLYGKYQKILHQFNLPTFKNMYKTLDDQISYCFLKVIELDVKIGILF